MVFTFACTIATFIDEDWNTAERVVDFSALLDAGDHCGPNAAKIFLKGAASRRGLNKISPYWPTSLLACINFIFTFLALQRITSPITSLIYPLPPHTYCQVAWDAKAVAGVDMSGIGGP